MVEKTPFAVQLSGGEPTVDTQEVEVYNEKGIECQPMEKKTGPGEPNGSLGPVFVLEIFHFLDGPNGLCGIVSNGFCMWFAAPK